MHHLIRYDDETGSIEISDHGWREPYPGELTDLAAAITSKPSPWWLDFGSVVIGIGALLFWVFGMSGGK